MFNVLTSHPYYQDIQQRYKDKEELRMASGVSTFLKIWKYRAKRINNTSLFLTKGCKHIQYW